jgi:hypothetical protein
MLIFISFGVGVIFAGLMGIVERYRLSRKVAVLGKELKMLEKNQTASANAGHADYGAGDTSPVKQ